MNSRNTKRSNQRIKRAIKEAPWGAIALILRLVWIAITWVMKHIDHINL